MSRQTNYAEFLALLQLFRARGSCTVAVNGRVLAVTPLAVIVARAILFTDTTRNVMHRVFKNNFSLEQSPDETGEARFYGRNDAPRYSFRSKPKVNWHLHA